MRIDSDPVRLYKLCDLMDGVFRPTEAHNEELREALNCEATETVAKI